MKIYLSRTSLRVAVAEALEAFSGPRNQRPRDPAILVDCEGICFFGSADLADSRSSLLLDRLLPSIWGKCSLAPDQIQLAALGIVDAWYGDYQREFESLQELFGCERLGADAGRWSLHSEVASSCA